MAGQGWSGVVRALGAAGVMVLAACGGSSSTSLSSTSVTVAPAPLLAANQAQTALLAGTDFGGFYGFDDTGSDLKPDADELKACDSERTVQLLDRPMQSRTLDRDDAWVFVDQALSVSSSAEAAARRYREGAAALKCGAGAGLGRDSLKAPADDLVAYQDPDPSKASGDKGRLVYLREGNVLMLLIFVPNGGHSLQAGEFEWVVDVAARKVRSLAAGQAWPASDVSVPPRP